MFGSLAGKSVILGVLQNCEGQEQAIAKETADLSRGYIVGERKEDWGLTPGIPDVEELTIGHSED